MTGVCELGCRGSPQASGPRSQGRHGFSTTDSSPAASESYDAAGLASLRPEVGFLDPQSWESGAVGLCLSLALHIPCA